MGKSDKEKLNNLQNIFQMFSLQDDQDQEVEQHQALPIQSQESLKALTLEEIKDETKMLNQKKAPSLDLITAGMLKELPNKVL